jgi:hypothetical protein
LLTLKNSISPHGDKVRAYCHLNVNSKSVNFMLDCSAMANVLPLADATVVDPHLTSLLSSKS